MNEWLTITGILKKTNERDLSRVLKGILEKRKAVAVKISSSETLHKEYIISQIVKDVPGFMRPYCFFKCNDDYKKYPSSGRTSLCDGPGENMSIFVMPYLDEGSIRSYNWAVYSVPNLLHTCLQQIVCSLIQAYIMKGLIHNDTHLDNVLLRKTTAKTIEYDIDGLKIHIPTNGYSICIMDFEMAFNEVSTNRGRAVGQVYEDILHVLYDLRYGTNIEIHNDITLINIIQSLKEKNSIDRSSCTLILHEITKLSYTPKIPKTFIYDPTVFG
jgi:hypothetical protein